MSYQFQDVAWLLREKTTGFTFTFLVDETQDGSKSLWALWTHQATDLRQLGLDSLPFWSSLPVASCVTEGYNGSSWKHLLTKFTKVFVYKLFSCHTGENRKCQSQKDEVPSFAWLLPSSKTDATDCWIGFYVKLMARVIWVLCKGGLSV